VSQVFLWIKAFIILRGKRYPGQRTGLVRLGVPRKR